jgi:hypothetical protein
MPRHKTKKRASKQIKSRKSRFFLPYPLLIFLTLCAGVFLVAATLNVSANDLLVSAKVAGPPVTSPAAITSPVNGTHFSSVPISVSGTCPANAAYIELFRNNVMSGTAICSSGNFQLSSDLFVGQNDLVAHVFNVTDDEGPVSSIVTVFYEPPAPPSGTGGSSSSPSSTPSSSYSVAPLQLKTEFVYKGFYVGDPVVWPVEITGGTAPYAVNVNWGDGFNDVISRGSAGSFNLTHIYQSSGNNKNNSYTIKINAADNVDQKAYLQFFVIVNSKKNVSITGTSNDIFTKSPPSLGNKNWLWIAWPAYGLLVVMGISYLLGERAELAILSHRGLLKRRRQTR